jgi:PAS domain S-box-containing protein
MKNDNKTILLVEDEALIAAAEAQAISDFGYEVIMAHSGEEAVGIAGSDPGIDLVLMDIDLGAGIDGPEAAQRILAQMNVPIVFLTSHSEREMVEKVRGITRYGYVIKNSGDFVLKSSIEMALELFGAHRSINEKMNALRESGNEMRHMLKSMLNAFVLFESVFDGDGKFISYRFVYINDAYENTTGVKNGEVRGKTVHEVWPETEPEWIRRYGEVAVTGVTSEFEMYHDPTKKHYHCNVYRPWEGKDRFCVIFEDITERRRAEEALRVRNEELERVNEELVATNEEFEATNEELISSYQELMRTEETLRKSERRLETMLQTMVDGMVAVGLDGQITYSNQSAEKILGIGKDILGKYFQSREWRQLDERGDPYPLDRLPLAIVLREKRAVTNVEHQVEALDGERKWLSVNAAPLLDDEGRLFGGIASFRDITGRKRMEEALRESEKRYSLTLDAVNDGLWDWDVPSGSAFFSSNYYALLGYDDGEFPASYSSWRLLVHPEDLDRVEEQLRLSVESGRGFSIDLRMKMKSGAWLWVVTRGRVVERDAGGKAVRMVGTLGDIAGLKLAEEKVQKLLAEKELLLKEVHHRIKNYMGTMMSMLSLQANALKEPSAVQALRDARNRMQSMSVLYDKLYRSENPHQVSLARYLPALVDEVAGIFPNCSKVKVVTHIDDFIVDAKILSSLGIIVNELITNAMKYAFPGRDGGVLTVSFLLNGGRATLAVGDNGEGIPESIDPERSPGFGLMLVGMLTKQLRGDFRIERGNGSRCVLEFDV